MKYQPVIGLEVHAQLATDSKLFCGCPTQFGASANTHTCEVCLGMPGVLPVLNRRAVTMAVRAALALDCEVQMRSQWSRKNYFYPDLPKGYQITQFHHPYALGGYLDIRVGGETIRAGITRIHMEEDAGKTVHDAALAGGRSFVDFNRGGTPLIEIVGEPDLRSAAAAAEYMRTMRQLLRAIGVCDGNMEQGSLRCDANVSLQPIGSDTLGTRTELKNINSFRFVEQAIDFEIMRQAELLDDGGKVAQETRLWDTEAKVTRTMRSKEEAHDYRYFPEPDLPELLLDEALVDELRAALPELPAARFARYCSEFGLSEYDARLLVEEVAVAELFEATLKRHDDAKAAANWIINELLRELKDRDVDALPFGGEQLGELLALIAERTISGKIAKTVFAEMLTGGGTPSEIVAKRGLKQVSDTASLEPIIDEVIAANPDSQASYRAGKTKLIGFFVGQVMKRTRGQADPKMVNELLRKKLGEPQD